MIKNNSLGIIPRLDEWLMDPNQRWSLDFVSDAFTESFNGKMRDECLRCQWNVENNMKR